MAMNVGSRRGGQVSAINMTPMIDVLLVLLIIFMVMQQQLQRGLSAQVPPNDPSSPAPPDPTALVLEVAPGGVYHLNRQPIARGMLQQRLALELSTRNRKVLFVKADEHAAYGEVVHAMDASRAAGATVLGLVPRAAD
jgi:biopolymer transport protein TolR